MSRSLLSLFLAALMAWPSLAATQGKPILLVARDLDHKRIGGLRFVYDGAKSGLTNQQGETELNLPLQKNPGEQVSISLVPSPATIDWLLTTEKINVPTAASSAEVLLLSRRVVREIGARVLERRELADRRTTEITAEDRQRALLQELTRRGLTPAQFETALRYFSDTKDKQDLGIAACLQGDFPRCEELLGEAESQQERDLVETWRFKGDAQSVQGKYSAAAGTLRKAVAVRPDDSDLLFSLGNALYFSSEWKEAETQISRSLQIEERKPTPDQHKIAIRLNALALVYQDTNRRAEAEPLMRRALGLIETSLGPVHPDLATMYGNLALLLLETNRPLDAVPPMREALDIHIESLGPKHLRVGTDLNTLALLLKAVGSPDEAEPLLRKSIEIHEAALGPNHPTLANVINNLADTLAELGRPAEAEPLSRKALAIHETSLGPDHPNVAIDLSTLAIQLMYAGRMTEAESFFRRALAIDEKAFDANHPSVARDLNNLATLLANTKRLPEAESLTKRALSIYEKSPEAENLNLARVLHHLALFAQSSNRLDEAETYFARALTILFAFHKKTGEEDPLESNITGNFVSLLRAKGLSDSEIEASVTKLREKHL